MKTPFKGGTGDVKRKAWIAYLAAMMPLCLLYLFGPKFFNAGPVFNVIGASAAIVIVIAVRMHHAQDRWTWYLIALGQGLFVCGDVVAYNYKTFFHHELPYPSVADVLYLAVYPCLIAGLLILIRKRAPGGDKAGLIDSLIVCIGIGALSWRFLMAPYAQDATLTLLTKLVSIAYPLMDLLVLGVVFRLAIGGGKREHSFYLLGLAFVSLLVTDSIFGYMLLNGGYETGGLLDAGWMAFYVLLGAAALHPSMAALSDPTSEQDTKLTRPRLAMLAVGAVASPVTAFVLFTLHDTREAAVFVATAIVLFLLVVWRMAGLLRKNEHSALQERALREAGGDLVAATSPRSVFSAAIEAATRLAGDGADVMICGPLGQAGAVVIADASDDAAGQLGRIPSWAAERIARGHWVQLSAALLVGREERPVDWLLVTPLVVKGNSKGLLVIATQDPIAASTKDALTVLGTQVSLAIDSAHLTEDLVRRQSEARFASLVQNSSDIVTVVGPDTSIRYISPSVKRILGYDAGQLEGCPFTDLIRAEDTASFLSMIERAPEDRFEGVEIAMRRRDGSWTYVETVATNLMHEPSVSGIVLNTRDIGERKRFEEQLAHQAFSDSTTGLANRALLRNRIQHALDRQIRTQHGLAVLFIDLDDFKTVNDSLGHAAGDQLLGKVGGRIRSCLRSSDTPARLGGDEFAILLEDREDEAGVILVADRILGLFREPFEIEGTELFVTASIGVAFGGSDAERVAVDDLLRNADVAMYTAKQQGKGRYQIFEPAMHQAVMKRLQLKADLQRAVDNQEFRLVYQPVVDLESGRVHGVEALIRWDSPTKGIVPPIDFIPLAEETGLIVPIGKWVMEQACRDVRRLSERFAIPDLTVSVNVSARQLQRPEIIDEVAHALLVSELPASQLVVEITESLMMQDMALAELRMSDLKNLGVRIAVDDFGTGYSSLNYIRQFPVDILKIDKSFIDGLTAGGVGSLTGTILDLARVLNLRPIAEGVEDEEQVAELLRLGCGLGQGYLFSRPVDIELIERMLGARAPAIA